ncbi:MAG: methyltransferase type 12, partial [Deltaproteobacteria bacterium]|nr:methyltransferase type 12 [Deltaproteobacteria bacterium]
YIDVLEHIEKDELELKRAVQKLKKTGILIVLAPAHQILFTPFDDAIGHFRRYNKNQLMKISPPEIRLLRVRYLDSAGCLASLSNKFMLKSGTPTRQQIIFWDKILVPFSRLLDPLFGYKIGKSIYMVWQKNQ